MAPPPSPTGASCPPASPADVPVTAEKKEARRTGGKKLRWTDVLRCKFVDEARPSRRPVTQHCDVDAETQKQRLQREFARRGRATSTEEVEPVIVTARDDACPKKKGVPDAVAATTKESESPTTRLVSLLFPLDVLDNDEPPEPSSGPAKVPEFWPSVVADADKGRNAAGTSTPINRDLVDQLSEPKKGQARRRRALRWGGPALQNDGSRPNGDDAAAEPAMININLDARPKKGILKARPAAVAATATPARVAPLLPTGVLGKPPRSFRSSGPETCPAFLMSVIAARKGAGSRAGLVVDRGLVDQWAEAKENTLRRGRYLRDYCPFRRDDDGVPEETQPPEPIHVEEEVPPPVKMKTGLPFESPPAEAEFVKAVVSRHLLRDDFVNRCEFQRSCERFATETELG